MMTITKTLKVPGAQLHYEIRGSGPVLLLICGGHTDAWIFERIADMLADSFSVVTYDPRGNSRSPLDGSPTDQPIELLADDAHLLLEALTDEPAFVLGSSSGATTGIDLLTRYPHQVRKLVAHEPPLVRVLPDAANWLTLMDDVYATFAREGVEPAMARFLEAISDPDAAAAEHDGPDFAGAPPQVLEALGRMQANLPLFLGHEVRTFVRYVPELEILAGYKDRLVFGIGSDSGNAMPARPANLLAEQLGVPAVAFPGDHTGYAEHPAEFADALRTVFRLDPPAG